METNNPPPPSGDTRPKQTTTGTMGIIQVKNSSVQAAEIRKSGHAHRFPLPPGARLHLPNGGSAIEFRLANGRTVVQAIDQRTAQVELVDEGNGGCRTVVTSAPTGAPPKPARAAGARR